MASGQEGVDRLASVPMFSTLSKRQLGKIWSQMKTVHHKDGYDVVVEGRSGYGLHIVLEGTAKVSRPGVRVDLGPGDFFGEMSLIDLGPRTATVTATSPLTTAMLSSASFRSIAKEQPDILWKLLVHMTERLRAEQSNKSNLVA